MLSVKLMARFRNRKIISKISACTCHLFRLNKAKKYDVITNRLVGIVVKDIAIGARGLGFNFRAGQIGHSIVNGSLSLRCFCFVQLLSYGDGLRHSLHPSA